MAEVETTLTAQMSPDSETDSEFSGFKPNDLKRGASHDPH